MIFLVVKVLNLCALALHKILFGASFVGRVIVTLISGIFSAVYDFTHYIMLFLQIVYEDNITIFTEDIPNFFTSILHVLCEQIGNFQNGIACIFNGVEYRTREILTTVNYLFTGFIIIVKQVTIILKSSIVLLGQALWFIITFIPIHLPQLLKAGIQAVKDFVIDIIVYAYMRLLKITNFLTDVPLESFIGLISAILIVRLTIHYREAVLAQLISCYWSVVRQLMYFYYTVYNYFTDPEVRVIAHMASGQEITTGDETYDINDVDESGNGADALCVICQDRQKCVLTLPCRHVCLCTECCRRLYGYQRTCPICRTFIYHSVTIYL
ncbi:uncharacterized protein LOC132902510 [Amyelois transitella]|uniref:uncharacterized protein LOC132902510 n=1 Tax=Amyelois transitella TaxID=680683 RepID=UPI00298F665D|nr:uncharacterized protein LOC132902510 [Amyelois transitella]